MARRAPLRFDPIAEAHRQWIAHDLVEQDAMAATTSIMRAQALILHRVDAALAPFGLTFARYEVLALLLLTRSGALPLGKMGSRLMVHPASVTNAVQRLEDDGLVRRSANPDDGRSILAEITDKGRRLVEQCTERLNTEVFAAVPIPVAQQERAFKALKGVRKAFGDFA